MLNNTKNMQDTKEKKDPWRSNITMKYAEIEASYNKITIFVYCVQVGYLKFLDSQCAIKSCDQMFQVISQLLNLLQYSTVIIN